MTKALTIWMASSLSGNSANAPSTVSMTGWRTPPSHARTSAADKKDAVSSVTLLRYVPVALRRKPRMKRVLRGTRVLVSASSCVTPSERR